MWAGKGKKSRAPRALAHELHLRPPCSIHQLRMKAASIIAAFALALAVAGCGRGSASLVVDPNFIPHPALNDTGAIEKISRSEAEWRKLLTPEQYEVMRGKGTEAPFCGAFWNNHAGGTYYCAGCGLDLFVADAKFESGTGRPSFFQPVATNRVVLNADDSMRMQRVEVLCARCESHLGHVFDDGPAPTGKRFCMNSISMKFVPKQKQ
jgi:peptide-methionine (R)-S-oxide reductase